MTDNGRRAAVSRAMGWYVLPTMVFVAVFAYFHVSERRHVRRELAVGETAWVELGVRSIASDLQSIAADILIAGQTMDFDDFTLPLQAGFASHVVSDFSHILSTRSVYDQARLIDLAGNEIIRVDMVDGVVTRVPEPRLQNKVSKYYLGEILKLPPGEIYFSPLDANQERGRIATPSKMVFRVGMPVFDHDGNRVGAVVLNLLGHALVDRFRHAMNAGASTTCLLNAQGIVLAVSGGHDGVPPNGDFAAAFGPAWARMAKAEHGQFSDSSGLYTFANLYPGRHIKGAASAYVWKIVSHLPASVVAAGVRARDRRLALIAGPAYLVMLLICWGFAGNAGQQSRALAALRTSEKRYRDLVDGSIESIFIHQDGRIVYANEATAQMYGYDLSELIGLSPPEKLLHPDEVARIGQLRESLTRDSFGYRGRRRDGSTIWLQGVVREIEWQDRPAFQVTNQDITQRHLAEMALREDERRFRVAVDSLTNGVVIADAKGKIKIFNKAAERIFGYQSTEVTSRNVSILMAEDNRQKHGSYMLNYHRTGEAQIIGTGRDVMGRRKNGECFPLRLGIGDMGGGHPYRFIAAIEDLSGEKLLQEQLRQSQKMEAIGQLTGGVAHDFNNLLSIMLGNLELSLEQMPNDAKLRPSLERVVKAVHRGAALTRSLLAFSRKQPLAPKTIDINKKMPELVDMLRRTLRADIELVTHADPDLWTCDADPGQLENALLNLALNARDAMAAGGKLVIETANEHVKSERRLGSDVLEAGDYVVVSVIDGGAGMAPEVLERAFDPFFTTKDVGKGTGLGLSMVYGFARQSGGYVTIDSEPGEGTAIRLFLPRSRVAQARRQVPLTDGAVAIKGAQVLVVEDDHEVRAATVGLLQILGCRVIESADAPGALALIDSHPGIDILLADVVLQGDMDGPGLAEQARRLDPGIKVLFMSGYAAQAIVNRGARDQGALLLRKPFGKNELSQKLRQAFKTEVGAAA